MDIHQLALARMQGFDRPCIIHEQAPAPTSIIINYDLKQFNPHAMRVLSMFSKSLI
jgi:hypothetical protein